MLFDTYHAISLKESERQQCGADDFKVVFTGEITDYKKDDENRQMLIVPLLILPA